MVKFKVELEIEFDISSASNIDCKDYLRHKLMGMSNSIRMPKLEVEKVEDDNKEEDTDD